MYVLFSTNSSTWSSANHLIIILLLSLITDISMEKKFIINFICFLLWNFFFRISIISYEFQLHTSDVFTFTLKKEKKVDCVFALMAGNKHMYKERIMIVSKTLMIPEKMWEKKNHQLRNRPSRSLNIKISYDILLNINCSSKYF